MCTENPKRQRQKRCLPETANTCTQKLRTRHFWALSIPALWVRPPGRDPNPIEPPTERRPSHLRERQVRAPPQVPMEAGFTPPTEVILLSCIRI